MFISKVVLLAFFLLAIDVFAARVVYSAKYKVLGEVKREKKNANVPDHKEQSVLDNMKSWSDKKYDAEKSRHNMVLVVNAEPAEAKGKANDEVQEMQSMVNKNIK